MCSDQTGWNHGSVDRHVASAGRFRHGTRSDPGRRHQRVAVRLPLAARRPPRLPTAHRLCRNVAQQRPDDRRVGQTERTAGCAGHRHDIHVQVPRSLGLRAVAASLEAISGLVCLCCCFLFLSIHISNLRAQKIPEFDMLYYVMEPRLAAQRQSRMTEHYCNANLSLSNGIKSVSTLKRLKGNMQRFFHKIDEKVVSSCLLTPFSPNRHHRIV